MDFGVCVATKIDEVGIVAHAENLGYSHAWVPDSQMIWSDCYAYLALAAQQTRTIKIGTGVSVVGTRIAPVTAHSIATINRLAPGRTFLGIGTGNTAQRVMGQRPVKYVEYAEYTRVLSALLKGEEVEYTYDGKTFPIQFQMADLGFLDIDTPIPLHVSGFYPRTYRLAGQYGDGLVCSIPPRQSFVDKARENVAIGAQQAGRALPESFALSTLTTAAVLEPGEDLTSERVIKAVGPFALSSLHYIYDKIKENGGDPPAHVRGIWEEYTAEVEKVPVAHRHMRVHAGHCTFIHPDEVKFITPELIKGTCLVGSPGALIEQLRELELAGMDHVILLPSLEAQYRNFEEFSTKVMAHL